MERNRDLPYKLISDEDDEGQRNYSIYRNYPQLSKTHEVNFDQYVDKFNQTERYSESRYPEGSEGQYSEGRYKVPEYVKNIIRSEVIKATPEPAKPSCIESFEHYSSCPVCSSLQKAKKRLHIGIIIVLSLIILILLVFRR